jgi:hypothetical protein
MPWPKPSEAWSSPDANPFSRPAPLALGLVLVALLAACEGRPEPLGPGAQEGGPLLSSAQAGGGGSGVEARFLPPLGPPGSGAGGTAVHADPVVEVCTDPACAGLHARFDRHGQGPSRVRLAEDETHYHVNWDTRATGAAPGTDYWIRVLVGGEVAAAERVSVAATGRGGRASGGAHVVAGQTLPIRFRLGSGEAGYSIQLSPASAVLEPGGTAQFEAVVRDGLGEVVPGAAVLWSVNDETVATVDGNGLVTAVAVGLASLRADYAGAFATASITVTAPGGCDVRASGRTRFANFSPGAGTLDVAVDGAPLGLALAFGEVSGYVEFSGCSFWFAAAGDTEAVPVGPTRTVSTAPFSGNSVLLVGTPADDAAKRIQVVEENAGATAWNGAPLPPGSAFVEPFHAAAGLGGITFSVLPTGGTPAFASLSYLGFDQSNLLTIAAGSGSTGTLNLGVDFDGDGMPDFGGAIPGLDQGEVAVCVVMLDTSFALSVVCLAPDKAAVRIP